MYIPKTCKTNRIIRKIEYCLSITNQPCYLLLECKLSTTSHTKPIIIIHCTIIHLITICAPPTSPMLTIEHTTECWSKRCYTKARCSICRTIQNAYIIYSIHTIHIICYVRKVHSVITRYICSCCNRRKRSTSSKCIQLMCSIYIVSDNHNVIRWVGSQVSSYSSRIISTS